MVKYENKYNETIRRLSKVIYRKLKYQFSSIKYGEFKISELFWRFILMCLDRYHKTIAQNVL